MQYVLKYFSYFKSCHWQCDTNNYVFTSGIFHNLTQSQKFTLFGIHSPYYCNRLWALLMPDLFEICAYLSHLFLSVFILSLHHLFNCSHLLMAERAIIHSLLKLNGSNWFEWKKETETFLLLAGLHGIIDAVEAPTGAKAAGNQTTKDHKMYTYLFFLIEPNYHAPIINVNSGWTVPQCAWHSTNNPIHLCMTLLSVSSLEISRGGPQGVWTSTPTLTHEKPLPLGRVKVWTPTLGRGKGVFRGNTRVLQAITILLYYSDIIHTWSN